MTSIHVDYPWWSRLRFWFLRLPWRLRWWAISTFRSLDEARAWKVRYVRLETIELSAPQMMVRFSELKFRRFDILGRSQVQAHLSALQAALRDAWLVWLDMSHMGAAACTGGDLDVRPPDLMAILDSAVAGAEKSRQLLWISLRPYDRRGEPAPISLPDWIDLVRHEITGALTVPPHMLRGEEEASRAGFRLMAYAERLRDAQHLKDAHEIRA